MYFVFTANGFCFFDGFDSLHDGVECLDKLFEDFAHGASAVYSYDDLHLLLFLSGWLDIVEVFQVLDILLFVFLDFVQIAHGLVML